MREEEEVAIEHAFTKKGGLIDRTRAEVKAAQAEAKRTLEAGGVPHLGTLSEAMHLYRFYLLVQIRSAEGRTWAQALAVGRENALKALMYPDKDTDPWARAEIHSIGRAAATFWTSTAHL